MSRTSRNRFDLLIDQTKIKSCYKFSNDILVGEAGENLVASIFKNKKVKLEVKKDDWTVRSGNIAIEFESRGKPSGILTTKADFYCFVVGHYFVVVFPVVFLKQVYDKFKDSKRVKKVGDRGKDGLPTSKVILLPWKSLLKLFRDFKP